ncbi:MAG: glyoxalase [Candidatus Marinimicrobia bacterium]|nr:glyoxalase [Candidatus Neomarinimicrobiota bacterium]
MSVSPNRPFHLAFPVHNLKETEDWYKTILGCTVGRKSEKWIDFNFFGHQISAHLIDSKDNLKIVKNKVDSKDIPTRHFGIILTMLEWKSLAKSLEFNKVTFIVKPYIRFKGKKGEQATMFIKDPSDNYIEFKAFNDDRMIFDS